MAPGGLNPSGAETSHPRVKWAEPPTFRLLSGTAPKPRSDAHPNILGKPNISVLQMPARRENVGKSDILAVRVIRTPGRQKNIQTDSPGIKFIRLPGKFGK
jgi:hypothetical protein